LKTASESLVNGNAQSKVTKQKKNTDRIRLKKPGSTRGGNGVTSEKLPQEGDRCHRRDGKRPTGDGELRRKSISERTEKKAPVQASGAKHPASMSGAGRTNRTIEACATWRTMTEVRGMEDALEPRDRAQKLQRPIDIPETGGESNATEKAYKKPEKQPLRRRSAGARSGPHPNAKSAFAKRRNAKRNIRTKNVEEPESS